MNKNGDRLYFRCNCGSPDHNLVFTPDEDVDYPMVMADMQVAVGSLWSRVRMALSYLFSRHQRDYGHWHEVVLDRTDIVRLHEALTAFLENTTPIPLSYTRKAPPESRFNPAEGVGLKPAGAVVSDGTYFEDRAVLIDPSWWDKFRQRFQHVSPNLKVLYGPDDTLSTFFDTGPREEEE